LPADAQGRFHEGKFSTNRCLIEKPAKSPNRSIVALAAAEAGFVPFVPFETS
jgi:hypothetical protein